MLCVSDKGYAQARKLQADARDSAALIRRSVMVVQAALSAADAIANFRKLRDVSSRALSVEEKQQAHLEQVYWPAELQFLNEFTQATAWDSESNLSRRYAGRLWPPMAAAFQRRRDKLRCEAPRYCGDALARTLQELAVEEANARANVTLLARRIAYEEVQAVRDTDFERRKQAIAMRQGLVGQAAALMQAAAHGFSGALSTSLGEFNAALTGLGYESTRRQTVDPQFFRQSAQGLEPITPRQLARQVPIPDEPVLYSPAFQLDAPSFTVAPAPAYEGDYTAAGYADVQTPSDEWDGTGEPPSWVK